MKELAVLVVDKIYAKTKRHIQKAKACLGEQGDLYLACVDGFPQGLDDSSVQSLVSCVIKGSIEELARQIRAAQGQSATRISVLALNQSAIMPALALQGVLDQEPRSGFRASCDKSEMRRLLWQSGGDLAMQFCEGVPGSPILNGTYFASSRYIVKPAFGMSSKDVSICDTWTAAIHHAQSADHSEQWIPSHVIEALYSRPIRTDKRIVEPYIDGTEFSVDGWITGNDWFARVQHKLYMVQDTFIGDGPTVSPPMKSEDLPIGWEGLNSTEGEICEFGRRVLDAVGFSHGVFHIEGREVRGSKELRLIEINPRAPGGSLWRSFLIRTGYDLELVDASLQLGLGVPTSQTAHREYVLHYPFYADRQGRLVSWGDLADCEAAGLQGFTVDFVAQLDDNFDGSSMSEEPYLAFAVAWDDSPSGILRKCNAILGINRPQIAPHTGSNDEH